MPTVEISNQSLLDVHRHLIGRYRAVVNDTDVDREYWNNFCDAALKIKNPDKLSRWVGFIQGFLFAKGLLDVTIERDYSRQFYKPIYAAQGYDTTSVYF